MNQKGKNEFKDGKITPIAVAFFCFLISIFFAAEGVFGMASLFFAAAVACLLGVYHLSNDESNAEIGEPTSKPIQAQTNFERKMQQTLDKLSNLIKYHENIMREAEGEVKRFSTHIRGYDQSKEEIMDRMQNMLAKWQEKKRLYARRLEELESRQKELVIIRDLHQSEGRYYEIRLNADLDGVEEEEVLLTSLVDAFSDTVMELSQVEDDAHFDEYRHELDELSRQMQGI